MTFVNGYSSDVNKDWTGKDKDKDLNLVLKESFKDRDKD